MEPAPAVHYRLQPYGNPAGDDVGGDAHTEGEAQGVRFISGGRFGAGMAMAVGSPNFDAYVTVGKSRNV